MAFIKRAKEQPYYRIIPIKSQFFDFQISIVQAMVSVNEESKMILNPVLLVKVYLGAGALQ